MCGYQAISKRKGTQRFSQRSQRKNHPLRAFAYSFASCALIISLAVPITVHPQTQPSKPEVPQDDVVRINTTLVTVPVSVKDRHGKIVAKLKRENFHLFEDGVEQEIAYFEPPEDANDVHTQPAEKPWTVALLLDVSDSTKFKLKQIQDAATAFANQLRPEDRMLVMAFDKNVRVLTEPTNDRKVLRDAIGRTRTGGGTSLYDALDSVIAWLARISGRKAIVLLTDGVDTASDKATYESTVRAAEQLDAAVYPIQYNTYADFADNPSRQTSSVGEFGAITHVTKNGELASEAYKRATLYLRLLAAKTGGRFEYSDSLKYLSRSFTRIASELRQQYTLGYYPKNRTMSGTRELKVRVGVPHVVIRARKNYVYRRTER